MDRYRHAVFLLMINFPKTAGLIIWQNGPATYTQGNHRNNHSAPAKLDFHFSTPSHSKKIRTLLSIGRRQNSMRIAIIRLQYR